MIDEASIRIKSGKGGDGRVSFRREKYIPEGGPDGGDGGSGGDLYMESNSNLNTLLKFNNVKKFAAGDGEDGKTKKMSGKSGEDITIQVPKGTVVKDEKSGKVIVDFDRIKRVLLLKGGKGGLGNTHFKSSRRKAPYIALKGKSGIEIDVKLELKLLADVALVGLPNAGKSTFINKISSAKSKVGNYPFTTLEPKLGAVNFLGNNFVVADVPGLIEGASEGKGLGHKFLKHIERSRIILHLVDLTDINVVDNYITITKELEKYSEILSSKREIVVGTKMDQSEAENNLKALSKHVKKIFSISSFTGEGIKELLNLVVEKLDQLKVNDEINEVFNVSDLIEREVEEDIVIDFKDGVYNIGGRIVNSIVSKYVLTDDACEMLLDILRREKLNSKLKASGVKEGDIIKILGKEFSFVE